ncbi:MAG: arsenate reductase ArsC [bacterium]
MKNKILFLCTGNSCRSQMGEALFNHYRKDSGTAFSAGIEKHGLNPYMLKVLKELNIDTTKLYSKALEELPNNDFDLIITVCGHAHENCPYFPGKTIHHGFDDPPFLTKEYQDEEEILQVFRRVRDEIKAFILKLEI